VDLNLARETSRVFSFRPGTLVGRGILLSAWRFCADIGQI